VPGRGLYVASEGGPATGADPFVRRFGLDGRPLGELPVPAYYLPDAAAGTGVRDNLAFESLTATPDGRRLITATEGALAQDGPAADVGVGSPARVLVFELETGAVIAERIYPVAPVPWPAVPAGAFRLNGLVELLALGENDWLALERAYAEGAGLGVVLYRVSAGGATEVTGRPRLSAGAVGGPDEAAGGAVPVVKRRLLDVTALLAEHGIPPDNLEGLALGPPWPDGRASLWMVADDNFAPLGQRTLFLAFALTVPGREDGR
jgi:3-phytase/alkaline phosphatase D